MNLYPQNANPQTANLHSEVEIPPFLRQDPIREQENDTNFLVPQAQNPLRTISSFENCLRLVCQGLFWILKGVMSCFWGCLGYVGNNKFIFLIFLLILYSSLKLSRMVNDTLLFWLFLFPSCIIVIMGICHMLHSHSRAQEIQGLAMQRPIPSPEYQERLMHHMILRMFRNRQNGVQLTIGPHPRMSYLNSRVGMRTHGQIRFDQREMMRQILQVLGIETEFRQNRPQGLSPQQIASLPVEKYQERAGCENEACSICLDEFKQDIEVKRLPCEHNFHVNCIEDWLKLSNFCPNCKHPVVQMDNNAVNNELNQRGEPQFNIQNQRE